MKNEKMVMTLCPACLKQFRDMPHRKIFRVKKSKLDVCTYCNTRMGYDYKLLIREGNHYE